MMILLLDFFVNGDLFKDRVKLLQFKTIRGVLTVFLGNITGCARQTGCLMFSAFENDLMPVAF